ncbi:hypothetical protein Lfu02_58760 [Longispora fulva]|uniref:Uncharacterized protein n=1 Tax=Longispora fulva TaxID=619741 RepID=A0A8J7KQ91_9ACTN|nr:hypothetical protein [Longispora fulva]MBG6137142.1 hypothetical protein [Longispora fulva]GIG61504.1 hypothetical protein Lfu02_58760 [Longispora fulva]
MAAFPINSAPLAPARDRRHLFDPYDVEEFTDQRWLPDDGTDTEADEGRLLAGPPEWHRHLVVEASGGHRRHG